MVLQQRRLLLRVGTIILWGGFLLCNLVVIASSNASLGILGVLLLLLVFLGEFALLLRHVKHVAQWRAVIAFWVIYSVARIIAVVLNNSGNGSGSFVFMLAAVYTMFAGWFAIIALAIRRDVSVVYLAIGLLTAPILLHAQILYSGGVLAWLTGGRGSAADIEPFNTMEPVVMAISCMLTLALLTFLPHLLALLWHEWRGVSGAVLEASVKPGSEPKAIDPIRTRL